MTSNNYVYSREIGPFHYKVKQDGGFFTLWLNGCRIGTPDGRNIVEFKARTLGAAKKELKASAIRELSERIDTWQAEVNGLIKELKKLI